jgi:hypothetical protein
MRPELVWDPIHELGHVLEEHDFAEQLGRVRNPGEINGFLNQQTREGSTAHGNAGGMI